MHPYHYTYVTHESKLGPFSIFFVTDHANKSFTDKEKVTPHHVEKKKDLVE